MFLSAVWLSRRTLEAARMCSLPAVKISFPVASRKVSWTTMESQRLFIDSRLIHCPGSTESAHLSGTCRFYCFSPGLREKSPDLGRGVARNVCER